MARPNPSAVLALALACLSLLSPPLPRTSGVRGGRRSFLFAAAADCSADPGESGGGGAEDSGFCAFNPDAGASASAAAAGAGAAADAQTRSGRPMVLHGTVLSTCTRRVLLTMLEKRLQPDTDFKVVTVDLAKGEQKSPQFLKLQPFGVVPVLENGKLTLFESRAIARYIADKYDGQGTPLLGSTLEERAMVTVWLEVESQNFNPPMSALFREMVLGPRTGKAPDKDRAREHADKVAKVLDVYEARLASVPYLAGAEVSLADLVHVPSMNHLWAAGYSSLVDDRPNVKRWWHALSSRPAWKMVLDMAPK